MPRRADMKGWTPPRIIEHHGFDDPDQPSLPGMPGHERLPAGGIDKDHRLWSQHSNPNVWGNLAHAHHNPFHARSFGGDDDLDQSWERHDGWDGNNGRAFGKMMRDVKRAISGSTPCIAVNASPLHQVLDEGRVKSQFETGTSNGMLYRKGRAGIEHMQFGYPDQEGRDWHAEVTGRDYEDFHEHDEEPPADHPNHARPIYGYLAKHTLANAQAHHYGSHVLVLKKPHVWHRTTATIGDSLNNRSWVRAQPVQDFNEHAVPIADDYGHLEERQYDEPEKDLAHRIQMYRGFHPDKHWDYTEAQIHGGVHLNDIHYAILRGTQHTSQLKDLKAHLTEKGVPWVHTNPTAGYMPDVHDHSGLRHQARLALDYQAKLVQAVEAQMSGTVIATQGDGRYLIDLHNGKGQIADTQQGVLYDPMPIESILARGYWQHTTEVDVNDVLALVRPAV